MRPESEVYRGTIASLEADGWHIVCASPPGGTDMRYRRCVLPRFDPLRTERGLRDEVDVIAARENVILVIECKPLMSDSLQVLNHLGESDYDKLKRLAATHTPARLSALLRQATGSRYLPAVPSVELALAVSDIDVAAPDDIAVFVVDDGVTLIQP